MDSYSRCAAITGITWVVWGFASLSWTPDPADGLNEMIVISLGILLVATLAALARHSHKVHGAIRIGWASACLITLPFAAYELIRDVHLPNTIGTREIPAYLGGVFRYAAVTFGNRNNYAAFLVLALPFLFWSAEEAKTFLRRGTWLLVGLSCIFIVFTNGSRLGMVAIGLQCAAWFSCRRWQRRQLLGVFVCLLPLCVGVGALALRLQPAAASRWVDLLQGVESEGGRVNLTRNALVLVERSYGLGVGAGGVKTRMADDPHLADTDGLTDVHNVWVEILASYGFVVWALFATSLGLTFGALLRSLRFARVSAAPSAERRARCGIVVMAGLPPCLMMGSSILRWTMLWAAIGAILALAAASRRPQSIRGRHGSVEPRRAA